MSSYYQKAGWKKPLTLALVLTALGGLTLWLETSYRPKKEQQAEIEKKLFPIKEKAISSIRFSDGKRTYQFKCNDLAAKLCRPGDSSKWNMTEPLQIKADDSSINSLVSAFSTLLSTDVIDLKVETPEKKQILLTEYKLDESVRKNKSARFAEVQLDGGSVHRIFLGDTHPIGETQYAMTEDDSKVFLIPTSFKGNFEKPMQHWRDKKILNVSPHQIASFKMTSAKSNLSATRKESRWVIQTHPKDPEIPGDIENIDTLLNAIAYLSAKDFASESKSDPKGKSIISSSKKLASFELTTEKEPIHLQLYQKGGSNKPGSTDFKLYATVSTSNSVFELEANNKERLVKELKELRLTKLLTSMDRFNAKKLVFTGPLLSGKSITLENQKNKWIQTGETFEVDFDKVTQFFDRISGNKIQEFIAQKGPAKNEESAMTIELDDDKTKKSRSIKIWKTKDQVFARDLGQSRPEIYRIDPIIFDSLPKSVDFFKKTLTEPKKSDKT